MNKLALSAALAALALSPVLSQAAHADDTSTPAASTNWQDNFFVAGQLGQSQYRVDSNVLNHDHGVFQNVRFGWQAQRLRCAKILALRSRPRNKPNWKRVYTHHGRH